jgi:hypothetical protein
VQLRRRDSVERRPGEWSLAGCRYANNLVGQSPISDAIAAPDPDVLCPLPEVPLVEAGDSIDRFCILLEVAHGRGFDAGRRVAVRNAAAVPVRLSVGAVVLRSAGSARRRGEQHQCDAEGHDAEPSSNAATHVIYAGRACEKFRFDPASTQDRR